jgi:hypothetical protein
VHKAEDVSKFVAPIEAYDVANEDDPHYAGMGSVFGGKPGECANCTESKPISILVDIGKTMTALGLKRNQVALKVVTVDQDGVVATLEQLIADGVPLTPPRIVGPIFDGEAGAETMAESDVMAMQSWLARMGYYDGAVDGKIASAEGAVTAFQTFTGLTTDGVVGPKTIKAMTQTRNDSHADVGAGEEVLNYAKGDAVK